jgi:Na+/H+-dicarboxylate symporter
MLLMRVAPIGIFCLVAAQFGREVMKETFADTFHSLLYYLLAVSLGVGVHLFVTLPLVLFLLTRRNPYRFMVQMLEALLTAFSTSSSAATLPVTMECATKRAGVSRRSVEFVLPLGTTVNMDGTAIYQACAALFVAQAFGIDLGLWEQLTIVLATVLASIGTPGVPQGGLIALLIVLGAVGLPLEGKALALIFSVDWFVDRLRTLVNVFGDAIGAAVVQRAFRK